MFFPAGKALQCTLQNAQVHYNYTLLLTISEKIYMLFIYLQRYIVAHATAVTGIILFSLKSDVGVLGLNSFLYPTNYLQCHSKVMFYEAKPDINIFYVSFSRVFVLIVLI